MPSTENLGKAKEILGSGIWYFPHFALSRGFTCPVPRGFEVAVRSRNAFFSDGPFRARRSLHLMTVFFLTQLASPRLQTFRFRKQVAVLKNGRNCEIFQEVLDPMFPEAIIRRRFPSRKANLRVSFPGAFQSKMAISVTAAAAAAEREAERTRKERGRGREREIGLLLREHPEGTSAKFWDIRPTPSPTVG